MLKGKLVLYIVCHDDASEREAREVEAELSSDRCTCIIARISGKTRFFENEVWHRVLGDFTAWSEAAYVGMLAYSCRRKVPVDQVRSALSKAAFRDPGVGPDVLAMYNLDLHSYGKRHVISAATQYHGPGFETAWHALLYKLGFGEQTVDRVENSMPGFYCNYWMAKPYFMHVYLAYVTRAMQMITSEPELASLFNQNARYYCGSLTPKQLVEVCGQPYYTMHPFVLERLPSFIFTYMEADIERSTAVSYR